MADTETLPKLLFAVEADGQPHIVARARTGDDACDIAAWLHAISTGLPLAAAALRPRLIAREPTEDERAAFQRREFGERGECRLAAVYL